MSLKPHYRRSAGERCAAIATADLFEQEAEALSALSLNDGAMQLRECAAGLRKSIEARRGKTTKIGLMPKARKRGPEGMRPKGG
jgi:hypothetical protein